MLDNVTGLGNIIDRQTYSLLSPYSDHTMARTIKYHPPALNHEIVYSRINISSTLVICGTQLASSAALPRSSSNDRDIGEMKLK